MGKTPWRRLPRCRWAVIGTAERDLTRQRVAGWRPLALITEVYLVMAIYHLSAQMISRSSGRSATAAAAYRAAERIPDHRQGLVHDYSKRSGVLHSEILAPEGTPEALRGRAGLWNAVEATERRKDAQVAREVTVALPHELTGPQRAALVRSFVQEAFVDRGMIADIALHAPGGEGDQRNHHAHIMLTTRAIGEGGFGGKERAWNNKAVLAGWRQGWADHANRYLREIEASQEIDHRSLEAQRDAKLELKDQAMARGDTEAAHKLEIDAVALDRDPLPDIGWQAWGMERRGIETAAGDLWRKAQDRLVEVRGLVSGLRERFVEAYGHVRDGAAQSLSGLSAALRGADFSTVDAANQQVKEQAREVEKTQELEREQERGYGMER